MEKRKAKAKSCDSTISVGELRAMIATARATQANRRSKVNPAFSLDQVCNIYEAALAGRDDAEIPKAMRYSVYRQREMASKDSLIIRNILRDCA